ncbi:hypothetical protein HMPREF3039_02653 [Akkermansia sp. KLE1798]|nr:hypothetical protein HMPREF3039_02653 [Akkermansia sp. KLE1798]
MNLQQACPPEIIISFIFKHCQDQHEISHTNSRLFGRKVGTDRLSPYSQ